MFTSAASHQSLISKSIRSLALRNSKFPFTGTLTTNSPTSSFSVRYFSSDSCCGGSCSQGSSLQGKAMIKNQLTGGEGGCCGGCSCSSSSSSSFSFNQRINSFSGKMQQMRSFSKVASPSRQSISPSQALVKRLDEEMKMELEEHEFSQHIANASMPPELASMLSKTGFRLESAQPGSSLVRLVREQGGEVVRVEFDVEQIYQNGSENAAFEEDEGETGEGEEPVSYQLEVEVQRKDTGDALRAECWLHEDFCELNFLRFVPNQHSSATTAGQNQEGGAAAIKGAFMGPSIGDLDEELSDSLSQYLTSKGLNGDLYEFVSNYALFKESCEYYKWCNDLKGFVAGVGK